MSFICTVMCKTSSCFSKPFNLHLLNCSVLGKQSVAFCGADAILILEIHKGAVLQGNCKIFEQNL